MIGYLRGKLIYKQPPNLMIEVAGVGYEVSAPMSVFYDLPEPGNTIELYAHLAVSENAHTLYGFLQFKDRTLFRTLVKVSGVGPKLALTILSGISVEDFAFAIDDSNVDRLVRLPGIGKKTAERLIVEMKDPLRKLDLAAGQRGDMAAVPASATQEAYSALQSLGYKDTEITRMLKRIDAGELSTEEIIRLALKDTA